MEDVTEESEIIYLDDGLPTESDESNQPRSYVQDPAAYDEWYSATEEVGDVKLVAKQSSTGGSKKLLSPVVAISVMMVLLLITVILIIRKRRR